MTKETLKSLLDAAQGEGEIFEMIALSGGEITLEIEEAMERAAIALPEKIDSYYAFQQNIAARVETLEMEIMELSAIKQALEKISDRANDYMFGQMKQRNLYELAGNTRKYKIVPCAKRTVIDDEQMVPTQFKVVETVTKIDKKSIKEALEAGREVAGAHLEGGEALRCLKKIQ